MEVSFAANLKLSRRQSNIIDAIRPGHLRKLSRALNFRHIFTVVERGDQARAYNPYVQLKDSDKRVRSRERQLNYCVRVKIMETVALAFTYTSQAHKSCRCKSRGFIDCLPTEVTNSNSRAEHCCSDTRACTHSCVRVCVNNKAHSNRKIYVRSEKTNINTDDDDVRANR